MAETSQSARFITSANETVFALYPLLFQRYGIIFHAVYLSWVVKSVNKFPLENGDIIPDARVMPETCFLKAYGGFIC